MSDSLVYSDIFVSVFVDPTKCLVIFVNDRGASKVINYDDNFYSVEDDIFAYDEMLKDSLTLGGELKAIREVDKADYERLLGDYIKSVESQCEDDLNWEYLESRGYKKCL